MFGRFRRFVQRNFGNITIGVLALPLFYRLTRLAARKYITYKNQRAYELIKQYKKQQMFEMMEENFEKTFRTWFELMQKSIKERLNAEMLTERLRNGDGDKLENWRELKIVAFARILSYIYGSSMLTILLRVQTNVISGLLFKQLDETPTNLDILRGTGQYGDGGGDAPATIAEYSRRRFVTEEIQEEYMILTRHLCTEGVTALCDLMKEKSQQIVGNLSLKQKLTVGDIEQLFSAIRNKEVKDKELNDWCPVTEGWNYMFSEEAKIQFLYPSPAYQRTCWVKEREAFLRILVGEAFDLVNAEDSRTILKFLEAQGLNFYLDRISEFINTVPQAVDSDTSQSSDGTPTPEQSDMDLNVENSAAVAKLIPIMNSFVDLPYSDDMWATLLLRNESLKLFSANVYESYSSKKFD